MVDQKKDFFYYFNESMSSVGCEVPQNLFGSLKKAGETIAELVFLFSKLPASATITELAIAFGTASGSAIAGNILVAQGILVSGGAIYAGGSAAFYIGACMGACIYAAQMMTIGEFTFAEADIKTLLNQAKRLNISIPQDIALKMIASKSNAPKLVAA